MFALLSSTLMDIDHSLSDMNRFGWKMMAVSVGIILGAFLSSAVLTLMTY